MKVAIMQPYFFPYIGYFQLMNYVDTFVVYDNIKYTKKGWINRNRILEDGRDTYISLPLKRDSDYLNINERFLAANWGPLRTKLINKTKEAYRKAPWFAQHFPVIEELLLIAEDNLFMYLYAIMIRMKEYLGIDTKLIASSKVPIDHSLKNEQKVIAICNALNAEQYVNPVGGIEIYNQQAFINKDLDISFLRTQDKVYTQFGTAFIPKLSIIDVLMFNSLEDTKFLLNCCFDIINP